MTREAVQEEPVGESSYGADQCKEVAPNLWVVHTLQMLSAREYYQSPHQMSALHSILKDTKD